MSKLRFKKFVGETIKALAWGNMFGSVPLAPAKREFIDMTSSGLYQTALFVITVRDDYRAVADTYVGDEFDSGIKEFDRLISRILVELSRRGDLSGGSMSYLMRLANSDAPSDQTIIAS